MTLLAEAQPTANFFWQFVLSIGVLFAIGANIATVLAYRRTQKREVTFGFEPASKREFDAHAAANTQEHRDLFAKIGGVERGGKAHTDSQVGGVRNELVDIGKSVAALETATEQQNEWLERIDAKIDLIQRRA